MHMFHTCLGWKWSAKPPELTVFSSVGLCQECECVDDRTMSLQYLVVWAYAKSVNVWVRSGVLNHPSLQYLVVWGYAKSVNVWMIGQ